MVSEKLPRKIRDDEILEAREEEYRKLRRVYGVCTFTVYGPLAEFINTRLKDKSFIRDVCGLRSESELMNAIIFIFKVIYGALGPRVGAYLPKIVELLAKHREDEARRLVESMIADAFRRPLECPREAIILYTNLRQCLGDELDKVLNEGGDICLEVKLLLDKWREGPGLSEALKEIIRRLDKICEKLGVTLS